jgi:hypothetical protein
VPASASKIAKDWNRVSALGKNEGPEPMNSRLNLEESYFMDSNQIIK